MFINAAKGKEKRKKTVYDLLFTVVMVIIKCLLAEREWKIIKFLHTDLPEFYIMITWSCQREYIPMSQGKVGKSIAFSPRLKYLCLE